jgi:hypothetical protein
MLKIWAYFGGFDRIQAGILARALRMNRVKVDFQKREYAQMLGEVTEKFRQSQILYVTKRKSSK